MIQPTTADTDTDSTMPHAALSRAITVSSATWAEASYPVYVHWAWSRASTKARANGAARYSSVRPGTRANSGEGSFTSPMTSAGAVRPPRSAEAASSGLTDVTAWNRKPAGLW